MQETESLAAVNKGIKTGDSQGEFPSGQRNFNWALTVSGVEGTEDLDLSDDLNKVILTVSWTEKNYPKVLGLETLLRNKKE